MSDEVRECLSEFADLAAQLKRDLAAARAVLDTAEVFAERQPLVCTDGGIIEDPSQLAIVVDRAAWEAWVARGRQT